MVGVDDELMRIGRWMVLESWAMGRAR